MKTIGERHEILQKSSDFCFILILSFVLSNGFGDTYISIHLLFDHQIWSPY